MKSPVNPNARVFRDLDDNDSNNIKVVIRVRPFSNRELEDTTNQSCLEIVGNNILIQKGTDLKSFNFDFVGDEQLD